MFHLQLYFVVTSGDQSVFKLHSCAVRKGEHHLHSSPFKPILSRVVQRLLAIRGCTACANVQLREANACAFPSIWSPTISANYTARTNHNMPALTLEMVVRMIQISLSIRVKVKFCPHPPSFSRKSCSRSLPFQLRALGPPVPHLLLLFALPSEFASYTLRASRCSCHRAICLVVQP